MAVNIWKSHVHCGWRNEYRIDLCSKEHYWTSSWNKAWKKNQAHTGFEPMTSVIPLQHSTNWANNPTGSWSLCWIQINLWGGEIMAVNVNVNYHMCAQPLFAHIWFSYVYSHYSTPIFLDKIFAATQTNRYKANKPHHTWNLAWQRICWRHPQPKKTEILMKEKLWILWDEKKTPVACWIPLAIT